MAEAIGAVLAYAVGIGISPIPIIAVILMLFSRRANLNGPLFVAGWLAGLGALVTALALLAGALDLGPDPSATQDVSWLRIVLGSGLLVAAGRKWHHRPRPGEAATMPAWMAGVDDLTPARAVGLAVALSLNPKNLLLAVGAVSSLSLLEVNAAQAATALVVFVVVAGASVIAAVAYDLVGGERARASLEEAKGWLTEHNSAVMAVLFVVFGAVLIGQGLAVAP